MIHAIFDKIGAPVLTVIFVVLFLFETKCQLRKRVQNRWRRIIVNLLASAPSFALLRFMFLPAMVWLAYTNETYHVGLNYQYALPSWMEAAIAFIVLDYGNYLWHVLNHKIPLLWRFHLVHHTDPDLDITTAFRFHFGEMIGSLFFRGAFVFFTGATPLLVLIYEIIFEAATQFHHSNWKLPIKLEKLLNIIFVTPRMHGIHHSIVQEETDSNYSVIFSCWDRLHKTMRLHVKQDDITIGVAPYNNPAELTTGYLLKLPFTKIRKGKRYKQ
ncbi:MAG: hypothetical protein JWR61_4531 [Ferruginibacter sp.]|uniref:sterol desaturase family protein n=1 Tax=Ferruginibacter sp. TaxID=1940288 RepID=UPI0026590419|nr:sterol desaturase family protein [Ferruginibacter sp.]MDB5279576.1 hypothetical protein [Ferruginibacter sp.]